MQQSSHTDSISDRLKKPQSGNGDQARANQQGRLRNRDLLRKVVQLGIFFSCLWLEQALNLVVTVGLAALVVGLVWLAIAVAVATCFLWLPICLISLPLLMTVGALLKFTRLSSMIGETVTQLQSEPLKSKIWSQGILMIAQQLQNAYFKVFPAWQVGQNSGYALLGTDGIIKTESVFSQLSDRHDIFQLQMYYYAAMKATQSDSLRGLRVLDVSHGQASYLQFLVTHFNPQTVVGYDAIRRQFTTSGQYLPGAGAQTMNLAQMLSHEHRFDLVICIETWNKLGNQQLFLNSVRELLNQSEEKETAPYIVDDEHQKRRRVVIADIFPVDRVDEVKELMRGYFEIEDVYDISINVQEAIIKQKSRVQAHLETSSHLDIAMSALQQLQMAMRSKRCPLTQMFAKKCSSAGASEPLLIPGAKNYDQLQSNARRGFTYLIFVLKHKEPLQDSLIQSMQN